MVAKLWCHKVVLFFGPPCKAHHSSNNNNSNKRIYFHLFAFVLNFVIMLAY